MKMTPQRSESRSRVALVETGPDLIDDVLRAMEAADWKSAIPKGAVVAVKPNLGFDHLLPGAVTSPLVVEGVLRVLTGHASKIYVVEADQVVVDMEIAAERIGIHRLCERYGVEWVNLSRQPLVRVPVPNALEVSSLELPEILTRVTLVTVPVMKTHNKTVLSGAIKNQWGCLPTFRHNYHPVVNQVLRDLASVLRPAFTVLDATVALEGNGPKSGRPRVCNLLMASADPVAVDRLTGRITGLDRFPLKHIDLCAQAGIGTNDLARIDVVDANGSALTQLPRIELRPAKHNAVSWTEQLLRRSFFRKLMFESPLLRPLCIAARVWYSLWYDLFGGKRSFERARRESPYGAQWR